MMKERMAKEESRNRERHETFHKALTERRSSVIALEDDEEGDANEKAARMASLAAVKGPLLLRVRTYIFKKMSFKREGLVLVNLVWILASGALVYLALQALDEATFVTTVVAAGFNGLLALCGSVSTLGRYRQQMSAVAATVPVACAATGAALYAAIGDYVKMNKYCDKTGNGSLSLCDDKMQEALFRGVLCIVCLLCAAACSWGVSFWLDRMRLKELDDASKYTALDALIASNPAGFDDSMPSRHSVAVLGSLQSG